MTVYIGCDFHPYQQTVAYCDTSDGIIHHKTIGHDNLETVRSFYKQFQTETIVAIEASSTARWFERMLFELNHKLLVGHSTLIRRRALSRHKSDKRDAELILDLIVKNEFPTLWRRDEKSREVLEQLRFRQALVKHRTQVCNRLQSVSRSFGLSYRKMTSKRAKTALQTTTHLTTNLRSQTDAFFELLEILTRQIKEVENWCERQCKEDESAKLLLTHPGIGNLTALCLVHTLGDVSRFQNARQVTAFVGLDPVENSSAARKVCGSISKAGSSLLRFLLVQAGVMSIGFDKKLKSFYSQLSHRRGKAIAKVAVARKLLIRSFIMLRDRIDYAEFTRRGVEVGLPV